MLTFLFTSFMPSNILAGNSVAEAVTETVDDDADNSPKSQIEAQIVERMYEDDANPAWETDKTNDPKNRVKYKKDD